MRKTVLFNDSDIFTAARSDVTVLVTGNVTGRLGDSQGIKEYLFFLNLC